MLKMYNEITSYKKYYRTKYVSFIVVKCTVKIRKVFLDNVEMLKMLNNQLYCNCLMFSMLSMFSNVEIGQNGIN